jgi:hypothetical protein
VSGEEGQPRNREGEQRRAGADHRLPTLLTNPENLEAGEQQQPPVLAQRSRGGGWA